MRYSSFFHARIALFVTIACLLVAASPAAAQTAATITGIVGDTSGGVLPGARITLRQAATGLTRTVTTPADGRFVFAGGGMKQGIVYGSSNSTASEPEEDALNVEDWATTIYHCLGIVADKELMAPGDRPIEIVDGGKVRKDLLA